MLETALITFLIGVQVAPPSDTYRFEREPVRGGSELVTLFGRVHSSDAGQPALEIPLLSVLRDTLGSDDPDAARLRYVWILTSTRPTALQRAASTLFFLRFRAGGNEHADRVPHPVLDLASPAKTVWPNLLANGVQAMQLDALGTAVRSSTRSYRENSSDYRKLQVYRTLGALEAVQHSSSAQDVLAQSDLREMYSRLSLSDRTLGGLVRSETLPRFYDKDLAQLAETRGHNWELLRQRAESEGLYFEPLALPGRNARLALLWVARGDLVRSKNRNFDSQFLGITNPWNDCRLREWVGYSETRYFDAENRPVTSATPDARVEQLIPLALYSLDYPRVPLLLADFRDNLSPKRREMLHHGVSSVLTGVLGFTRFGNWPFLAVSTTCNFVRGRHGAPMDRSARLRSYSEAREFLSADSGLQPDLRAQLLRRLDHLALNPLENALDTEARVAREQYAALMQYAASPQGLEARIDNDRRKELNGYTKSGTTRLFSSLWRVFSRPSADSEQTAVVLRGKLDPHRRAAAHLRYLEELLKSSPRPEVVRDPREIRNVLQALAGEPVSGPRVPRLMADVFERSGDAGIRMACLRGLRRLDTLEAQNELLKLARNPVTDPSWRSISLGFLNGDPEPPAAAAIAGAGGQF